jgi:hypothetical protein
LAIPDLVRHRASHGNSGRANNMAEDKKTDEEKFREMLPPLPYPGKEKK